MPLRRSLGLAGLGLAVAAAFASAAAAIGPPSRPATTPVLHATAPADTTPKTAVTLPGARYPWIHPVWVTVGNVTLATPPPTLRPLKVEPVWIAHGGITLARQP